MTSSQSIFCFSETCSLQQEDIEVVGLQITCEFGTGPLANLRTLLITPNHTYATYDTYSAMTTPLLKSTGLCRNHEKKNRCLNTEGRVPYSTGHLHQQHGDASHLVAVVKFSDATICKGAGIGDPFQQIKASAHVRHENKL